MKNYVTIIKMLLKVLDIWNFVRSTFYGRVLYQWLNSILANVLVVLKAFFHCRLVPKVFVAKWNLSELGRTITFRCSNRIVIVYVTECNPEFLEMVDMQEQRIIISTVFLIASSCSYKPFLVLVFIVSKIKILSFIVNFNNIHFVFVSHKSN